MKKKLIFASLLLVAATTISSSALSIVVDGAVLNNSDATIIKGRTFVPVASIAKATNADVKWDGSTKTVMVHKGETELKIKTGDNKARKNNMDVPLDAPARVINGKTFVPLSFIASSLDIPVKFDNETKIVWVGEDSNVIKSPDQCDANSMKPTDSSQGKDHLSKSDPEKEGKWIKGNKGSMLYHLPGGNNYSKVPAQDIVWFKTAAEAEAAGYLRAPH
ncbi:MAG: copper amine oxidase N-terminal domain-containing protein [Peptostreptococcaceae bacterium]|nr:copper amine oxidase N-terminal domain-containing protein [Peptostreptococcaceae bacterium]